MCQDNCGSVYPGASGNCCMKECKVGVDFSKSTNNRYFHRPHIVTGLAAQKICPVASMVETVMEVARLN